MENRLLYLLGRHFYQNLLYRNFLSVERSLSHAMILCISLVMIYSWYVVIGMCMLGNFCMWIWSFICKMILCIRNFWTCCYNGAHWTIIFFYDKSLFSDLFFAYGMIFHLSREVLYMEYLHMGTEIFTCALIKKKIKFSSHIRKFRMEQLQSHVWLTASSYMVKYLRISSYIRHILGSPSSYMTLQLLHSEFPYIWGKFFFFIISVSTDPFLLWYYLMIRSMWQWSRTWRMISNTCGMMVILDLSLPRPSWEMLTPSMEIEPPAASIILISYTSQAFVHVWSNAPCFSHKKRIVFLTQKKHFQTF